MPALTEEEWTAEGERRFGADQMQWRFVCPACGHVASTQDYKDAGASSDVVAFSCVGRWAGAKRGMFDTGPGPCDYAGGGLIRLNPVEIVGHKARYFAYAPAGLQAVRRWKP